MTHKILIVDDDPTQRRILEELVKRYGFDTVTADGASQGLDILEASRSKPVDLIILDLVMPEIDGLEFLERLSAHRTTVPVIVQTAQGSIETVVKAMRAGADDFVVKPINPERLKISIQNLLKVNALTEEVKRLNQIWVTLLLVLVKMLPVFMKKLVYMMKLLILQKISISIFERIIISN